MTSDLCHFGIKSSLSRPRLFLWRFLALPYLSLTFHNPDEGVKAIHFSGGSHSAFSKNSISFIIILFTGINVYSVHKIPLLTFSTFTFKQTIMRRQKSDRGCLQ